MNIVTRTRYALLGILSLAFAALAVPAQAGVATSGAVLLDPFDPVPEIQFHHFGGYGCGYGCGERCDYGCDGGYRGCGDVCGGYRGCQEGCRPHYRRHDCDDGCRRYVRDDCDRDCGRDDCDRDCDHRDGRNDAPPAPPCQSDHCYNAEHYERRWRDGDKVGQEWLDRGTRERTLRDRDNSWYGRGDPIWHDGDDDPPPAPAPAPAPADDHKGHSDHH